MKTLLIAAGLLVGTNSAWADDYTWNFQNTTTWTTAKIATGSAVNLATDGEAPEGDEPYVTFTFAGADDYGAEIKYNAASKSVTGTNLWYAYNGNISENNVSIVVPNNKQVTFNLLIGSNTRPTRYHLSNEDSDTNHDITSGNLVYSNTTGSDVTVTVWATNTRRTSGTTTTLQNGIVSIVLGDITYQYTINAVANIGGVETVVSTIASARVAPSATYSAYASKYVLYNGAYYELDDAENANLTGYKATYTMESDGEIKKINYKAATDVVFFGEWEKATQSISNSGYYTSSESSNYSGGFIKAVQGNAGRNIHQAFTIATAGKYLITMPYNNDNASARQYVLYLDGTAEANKLETNSVPAKTSGVFTQVVELTAASHTIYLMENGASLTPKFDYLKVTPATFTLASGEAQRVTFHNAGSGAANDENYKFNVYNGSEKVGEMRADWWCDVVGGNGNFTNPYLYSADGGVTEGPNVWASYLTDMQDADCDFTVSYTNGSLYIIGTMTKGNDIYYVNYTKTGLTGDVAVYLYGKNATLSNIATSSTDVNTTYVGPSNAVTAEITSAGAATFVSNYALDFTNVEDLQAYIATAQNGASITFDQVTGAVPANTPLLLRGTTANIPVAASAEEVGNNLLVAGTGAAVASEDNGKYNFILNKIDDVVGFYKAASQTVASNRAYLSLSDNPFPGGGAKSVTMIFNGETTGITTVAAPASKAVVKGTYNMQGQRVQNPSKGLYIVDGKKVAIN